jgi:hypothetical protein
MDIPNNQIERLNVVRKNDILMMDFEFLTSAKLPKESINTPDKITGNAYGLG